MLSEPKTEHRNELHYVAISKTVPMRDIPEVLPPLIPEVKAWMQSRNIEIAGPDFFLYKSMNQQYELGCVAGFPVKAHVAGDEYVQSGSFPAGTYASIIYTGDFKYMQQAHMALQDWVKEKGLKEKVQNVDGVTSWGGRTEFYLVDPDFEPNPEKWQTEIAFLLED